MYHKDHCIEKGQKCMYQIVWSVLRSQFDSFLAASKSRLLSPEFDKGEMFEIEIDASIKEGSQRAIPHILLTVLFLVCSLVSLRPPPAGPGPRTQSPFLMGSDHCRFQRGMWSDLPDLQHSLGGRHLVPPGFAV